MGWFNNNISDKNSVVVYRLPVLGLIVKLNFLRYLTVSAAGKEKVLPQLSGGLHIHIYASSATSEQTPSKPSSSNRLKLILMINEHR